MKQRVGEKIKLTSFNDLMGISEGESSVEIEISRIVAFQNHPFKVKDDEKMEELIESIRMQGILTPVLVRPDDEDGYEMISKNDESVYKGAFGEADCGYSIFRAETIRIKRRFRTVSWTAGRWKVSLSK